MNFFVKKKLVTPFSLCLILLCIALFLMAIFNPYPLKFKKEIKLQAQNFSLSPELVASVINTESGFNTTAVSASGACGLMQILPSTAEWVCQKMNIEYSQDLLFDAEKNIQIGCYYLNYLLQKFSNLQTALGAYNAGEGNVLVWLSDKTYSKDGVVLNTTPFSETNSYIQKVVRGVEVYKLKF